MMNKKNLNLKNDKRAVSPVIGVILMVAITVILAAVIAAFVFGMNPAGEKTPNVQLRATIDGTANTLTIKHMGGDPLNLSNCLIKTDKDNTITEPLMTLTVGESSTPMDCTGYTSGDAATIEVIYTPSNSYLLDTTITCT